MLCTLAASTHFDFVPLGCLNSGNDAYMLQAALYFKRNKAHMAAQMHGLVNIVCPQGCVATSVSSQLHAFHDHPLHINITPPSGSGLDDTIVHAPIVPPGINLNYFPLYTPTRPFPHSTG
jgi:hypothetical protein